MCLKLVIFKIFLLFFVTVDSQDTEGYYWREYTGEIPPDALPGGTNAQGETTYIGQVLHQEQLIPAKIDGEVYYEWGYQEFKPAFGTQPVKIFCTRFPEQFEWLSSGNGLLQYLENKHLIVGGFEIGAKIYIGRKQLEDELAVGKIISTTKQTTLNTTKGGIGYQHGAFEILTYNPNLRKHSQTNTAVRGGPGEASSTYNDPANCTVHEITINHYT